MGSFRKAVGHADTEKREKTGHGFSVRLVLQSKGNRPEQRFRRGYRNYCCGHEVRQANELALNEETRTGLDEPSDGAECAAKLVAAITRRLEEKWEVYKRHEMVPYDITADASLAVHRIMSLNACGYFAYNFNTFASKSSNAPWRLAEFPILVPVFLCLAGYLSLLACRLLLMTVDLHYSEPIQEHLISEGHEKRVGVCSLPSLFDQSAPKTNLHVVLLMMALTALFRFSLSGSARLAEHLDTYINGWLSRVTFIILQLACAYPLYWLQNFQIICVPFYLFLSFYDSLQPQGTLDLVWPWKVPILFTLFIHLFGNQLTITSIAAAAPTLTRQDVLLHWAVGMIMVEYMLLGLVSVAVQPFHVYSSRWDWADTVIPVISVLCDVSTEHICVRALADAIVAWRYGSYYIPCFRTRVVPVAISVTLISAVCFLEKHSYLLRIFIEERNFMLVSSVMLIAIPYCYHRTAERMLGQTVCALAPKWWSYALYAGGVCSLIGYFSASCLSDYMDMAYSILVNIGLAALLLLWHIVGRYLP